jgi:hypothetical protein
MNNIKIIKNCLDKESFNNIKNIMFNENFNWYYHEGVIKDDKYFQFIHKFYDNFNARSSYVDCLNPILKILKPMMIHRIKANLLTKTEKIVEHGFHNDNPWKCKIAILYINTCNGYTIFKDGNKVFSEENKLIIFDNGLLHSGSTCTDQNVRMVINFNYVEESFL